MTRRDVQRDLTVGDSRRVRRAGESITANKARGRPTTSAQSNFKGKRHRNACGLSTDRLYDKWLSSRVGRGNPTANSACFSGLHATWEVESSGCSELDMPRRGGDDDSAGQRWQMTDDRVVVFR